MVRKSTVAPIFEQLESSHMRMNSELNSTKFWFVIHWDLHLCIDVPPAAVAVAEAVLRQNSAYQYVCMSCAN